MAVALQSILVLLDVILIMCIWLKAVSALSFHAFYFSIRYQIYTPSITDVVGFCLIHMCIKIDNFQNWCADQYLYTCCSDENDIRVACT